MTNLDHNVLKGEPKGYFVVVPASDATDDDLNIKLVLYRLWCGRWWIVGSIVAFVLMAAWHAFTALPIYRSEASLFIRTEQGMGPLGFLSGELGGLASLAGVNVGDDSRRKMAVAMLQSHELAAEYVKQHDLMRLFYKGRWDEATQSYRGTWFRRAPTFNDAVNGFRGLMKVKEENKTGLIIVSFEWIEPSVAAAWVNEYIAAADARLRDRAIRSARQSISYLENELKRTSQEPIRQSLYRLMETRLNEVMLASVEPEYAFQIIDSGRVPDKHRFVRPRPMIEIILGGGLGFVLSSLLVLWRYREVRPAA